MTKKALGVLGMFLGIFEDVILIWHKSNSLGHFILYFFLQFQSHLLFVLKEVFYLIKVLDFALFKLDLFSGGSI